MQADPSLTQEPHVPQSAPSVPVASPAPVKKINVPFLVVLVLLLCTLSGLGIWVFTLNSNLQAAQAELALLKGDYDDLTAEKNKLSSEIESTTAELEAIKEELEAAKADLSKANGEIAGLRTRMAKALTYVEVMTGIFSDRDTFAETLVKVKATNDSANVNLYEKYMISRSTTDFSNWFQYFFETLEGLLT